MSIRKGITVMMDRPRVMRFTMNSLSLAEELTGTNLLSMDTNKTSIRDMRTLVFAALCDDDTGLTIQQAGELASDFEGGLGELIKLAMKALEEAFGPAQKNAPSPKPASKPKA